VSNQSQTTYDGGKPASPDHVAFEYNDCPRALRCSTAQGNQLSLQNHWYGFEIMSKVPNNKFFQACSTGKTDVVAAYLDSGIDPNARDKYQLTGLMWAGRKGRIEVADLLIKRGADVDAGDVRGRTALFHAVTYQRYEFVEFLAKLGANVSPIDLDDWTPLDFATESPDLKMVALLESLGGIRESTESEEGVLTEISIGQQSEGGDRLGWPKVHLYHMLKKHCVHCTSICPACFRRQEQHLFSDLIQGEHTARFGCA
jgi:Ankyrin repeats (3 copies)